VLVFISSQKPAKSDMHVSGVSGLSKDRLALNSPILTANFGDQFSKVDTNRNSA
jgi:hypothetical protein